MNTFSPICKARPLLNTYGDSQEAKEKAKESTGRYKEAKDLGNKAATKQQ